MSKGRQLYEVHNDNNQQALDTDDNSDECSGSGLFVCGEKQKCFCAKSAIYHEGDPIDGIYLIRAGMVKLLSYLPNGRARIVRLYSRGQYLGLEVLLGQEYEHSAVAIGDVEVDVIPVQTLRYLFEQNPGLLNRFHYQLHSDLMNADKWISEFSTGGIKPRVARLLRFLSEVEQEQPDDSVELLTVQEMAEILGVTQESVSRILAAFKRSDILHKHKDPVREIYQIDERLEEEALK